ncbi:MAG: hypothetical protein HOI86_07880 [Tateyamaria sp.]|jgi:hypothetical protein|nr:hypothetical protein [Tateyamaria sp.]MBT5301748.1 hypothetical protein [Tateyamaria sp.]MBT6267586.1 hypothetical protein [Tateyamaria sp.]MBT6342222.1 hypothetical protein [Tateyamaria sp.]MBT7447789.1 hypothetical protein [Tateyamaria sp.]
MLKLYFAPKNRAVRGILLLDELELKYQLSSFKLGDRTMRKPHAKI